MYALNIGVTAENLHDIRNYRDKLMRIRAAQSRKSGAYIAKLLSQTEHKSDDSRQFEIVIASALRNLGYDVTELGGNGEPEGIAKAFSYPTYTIASKTNLEPPLYSFTYDAKSSKYKNAKTGNLNIAGLVEHRDRYNANFSLVIAPGFEDGAVIKRCIKQKITPITALDLSKLLLVTFEYGAIPLSELKKIFEFFDPEEVSNCVDNIIDSIKQNRHLTIDILIMALKELRGKITDALPAASISLICRTKLAEPSITDKDVLTLMSGLSVLLPDIIGIENDKIIIMATPEKLADAIQSQLEKIKEK